MKTLSLAERFANRPCKGVNISRHTRHIWLIKNKRFSKKKFYLTTTIKIQSCLNQDDLIRVSNRDESILFLDTQPFIYLVTMSFGGVAYFYVNLYKNNRNGYDIDIICPNNRQQEF